MSDAVRVSSVSYFFDREAVLQDLSFSVPSGSIYGLLGSNGCGKSTTVRLLMGLLRRRSGQVEVLGIDPARDPVELKHNVGYVAENPSFYPWMRVGELLAFVAGQRPNWDPEYASRLLTAFGLSVAPRIRELSKGQRALVALLLAVAFRPKLLILDEPTSALDPLARRLFLSSVLAEYQEDGGTILICSHLIHEIAGLVDHVGLLKDGRMHLSLPVDTLRASVRRFRWVLGDAPSPETAPKVRCPGLLHTTVVGRQVSATVFLQDRSEAEIRSILSGDAPSRIDSEPLSFEDCVLELLAEGD